MDVKIEFPSEEELKQIITKFRGCPTENRVLIVSNKGEIVTNTGILLPTVAKEGIPKKGMIIQVGQVGDEYSSFKRLNPGDIVTYGLYAGKEVEFNYLGLDNTKYQLTILSLNEILYIEREF